MSCWIYLQPNIEEAMVPSDDRNWNWRQLWEVKCAPDPIPESPFRPSMRHNIGINYTRALGCYWAMESQYYPGPGNWDQFAFRAGVHVGDDPIPIPAGEWFRLDIVLTPDPVAGRFVARIVLEDGSEFWLGDYTGPTMVEGFPFDKWAGLKVYTDSQRLSSVHWQLVDDIKLWGDRSFLD